MVSKAELQRRRKKQKEVDLRLASEGISGRGGAEIGTSKQKKESKIRKEVFGKEEEERIVKQTKEIQAKETPQAIKLGKPKPTREEAIEGITGETRFSDVKEFGITGSDFGQRKREIFAEERPIEKGLLDAASLLTLGLLGGKTFIGIKGLSTSKAVQTAITNLDSTIGLTKLSGTAANLQKGKLVTIPGKFASKALGGAGLKRGAQYATNIKSVALTKSWLVKLGITSFIAKTIADLYGTFPFASFGKEETLQSISFPISQALKAGDLEGAQNLLDVSNEILNATPTIAEKIPYLNVQKEFQRYIEVQTETNKEWQRILNIQTAELTGEKESDFARERRQSDEAARERELANRVEDTAFFEGQAQEGRERRESEQQENTERFAEIDRANREQDRADQEAESERFVEIDEERRQAKLKEQELDSEYFRLIREKKFEEAEQLLQSRIG